MDLTALNAKLVDSMVEAKAATNELTTVKATLTSTETALTAAQTELAEVKAELVTEKAKTVDADQLSAATTALSEIYVSTLTAAGKAPAADAVPAKVEDLVAGIKEHQSKLTAIIVPGGVAAGANSDDTPKGTGFNARAYTGK